MAATPPSHLTLRLVPATAATVATETTVSKYDDFENRDKWLNNHDFVENIDPEEYKGGVLYLDGDKRQTTAALLAAGVKPSQCFAPDFDPETCESHKEAGINTFEGTLYEWLVKMGPSVIALMAHAYMDIMSDLFGTPKKLRRKTASGETENVSCYPLRTITHYLRHAPDETHLAITLCSSRRAKRHWKRGIADEHWFSIYEKTLVDLFKACGFEVVSKSEHNRAYKRKGRGALPMSFFNFSLRRVRNFDLNVFEAVIPEIYCQKHCIPDIGIQRWFPEYKEQFPQ